MTLMRWNSAPKMITKPEMWNQMVEEFFGKSFDDDEVVERVWSPRSDIIEDEDSYRVIADLPGLTKNDLDITLEEGVLTISGQRIVKNEKKNESVHLNERFEGKFIRKFHLSQSNIEADKISAEFKNGVLTVTLPKAEQAKPKKIEVKVS